MQDARIHTQSSRMLLPLDVAQIIIYYLYFWGEYVLECVYSRASTVLHRQEWEDFPN